MLDLVTRATQLAALLKQRGETVAVAESSTGGLISATLLAVPGASAYFIGGAVIYTAAARRALLGISDQAMTGMRASTEAYALLVARTARERFATNWAIAETGAAGPTGNRYGDAAGHSCIAVAGAGRARHHHRNRPHRPLRQHVRLHRLRARPSGGDAGRRALTGGGRMPT